MKYHVSFDIDLRRNSYDGKYIALEGVDGSGKTTQAKKLAEYFEKKGKKVIAAREPRKEGLVGDIIQKILYGKVTVPAVAIQYLFSADRSIHHEEVIVPALKAGNIVISDRCFWSAIVYGILDKTGGKYNGEAFNSYLIAQSILSMYHQFIVPDYTFYLNIPLNVAWERIILGQKKSAKGRSSSGRKLEIYEVKEKLEKVINGYDWLSVQFPKEVAVVDGTKSVGEVTGEIIKRLVN